jgi:hypothetical protein
MGMAQVLANVFSDGAVYKRSNRFTLPRVYRGGQVARRKGELIIAAGDVAGIASRIRYIATVQILV